MGDTDHISTTYVGFSVSDIVIVTGTDVGDAGDISTKYVGFSVSPTGVVVGGVDADTGTNSGTSVGASVDADTNICCKVMRDNCKCISFFSDDKKMPR